MVQTIDFFPKMLSEALLVKTEYEECVKGFGFNIAGIEVWAFDAEGNCTLSQEYLDSGFAECVGTYDKQSISGPRPGIYCRLRSAPAIKNW